MTREALAAAARARAGSGRIGGGGLDVDPGQPGRAEGSRVPEKGVAGGGGAAGVLIHKRLAGEGNPGSGRQTRGDGGAAETLAPPRGPRAGPQTGGGAAGAGGRRAHCGPRASAAERATLRTHLPPRRAAQSPAPSAPGSPAAPRHRPRSPPEPLEPLEPPEPPEPREPPGRGAGVASGPAFETTSAAAARPGDARLGQPPPLSPRPGASRSQGSG
ncbi:oleosin-B6-like [Canis lupus familiaris]|uniref:oleosin-B6-like n=1 Tax=Canis lupus familiaris TaxID=9615 RepID=UPI0018F7D980|nr:oleosin-B6-like [Canis lupus familiaris]